MATMEITEDIHPDAIICPDCGHDCDAMDCGDTCICVEEYDEDDALAYESDMRRGVYDDFDYSLEYSDGYDY